MGIGETVEARAPGKVIISGEHAVVHGTAAVAAALNLYTVVRISHTAASSGEDAENFYLHLPDLQVQLQWPMEYLKESLELQLAGLDPLALTHKESMMTIISDFVKREMPSNTNSGAIEGVKAFFFLYLSILGLKPLRVHITSELPVGAGLGSSAAFSVAAAGALLTLAAKVNLQADESNGKWLDLDDNGRDLVNWWAFEGEKIIHGKPSGVDNNVSCYGYVVRFKKGILTRLQNPMQVRMLITNTKVSRNTKALVAGVGERAKRHPTAMTAVFEAVEAICEEIVSILDSSTSEEHVELKESSDSNDLKSFAPNLVKKDDMIQTTSRENGSASLLNGSANLVNGSANPVNGTASLVTTSPSPVNDRANVVNGGVSPVNGSVNGVNGGAVNGCGKVVNGGASLVNGSAKVGNGGASLVNGSAMVANGGARPVNGSVTQGHFESKVHSRVPENGNKVKEHSRLEELMAMNQGLLQCMGVSHPSIELICQTTSRFNLCSKLTGAGGGGCVLTLLPNEHVSSNTTQELINQLELSGYQCFEAGIGGKGLQISYCSSL